MALKDFFTRTKTNGHVPKKELARVLREADLAVSWMKTRLQNDRTIAPSLGSTASPILQITRKRHEDGKRTEELLREYHAIRRYNPTLDAVVRNRRTLEGDIVIDAEDEGLQQALRDFAESVPVGALAGRSSLKGLNTYLRMSADSADEYGLGVGEIVIDASGRMIDRLYICDSRALSTRDINNDGIYQLFVQKKAGKQRIDDMPTVQVLSFSYATDGPWPAPLAWSALQVCETILRMGESAANEYWRFGDKTLITYQEYDPEAAAEIDSQARDSGDDEGDNVTPIEVPLSLFLAKEMFADAFAARRVGDVADLFTFITGGTMRTEVLGGTDIGIMDKLREHWSLFDGVLVALSNTPVWMYPHLVQSGEGLGSERSRAQALIASTDAHRRNAIRERVAREVLDMHLVLNGEARQLGRYDLSFESASILDAKFAAETRKVEAEAEAQEIENVAQKYDEGGTRRFLLEAARELEEKGLYMGV